MQSLLPDTRFEVVLNIGLNDNHFRNFSPIVVAREVLEQARLNSSFLAGIVSNTLVSVQHVGSADAECFACDEDTWVISLDAEGAGRDAVADYVNRLCFRLCDMMGQEAIAALLRDTASDYEEGAIVGPQAAKWGAFDSAKFIQGDARLIDAWSEPA